jgi:hypothetical protein
MELDDNEFSREISKNITQVFETWKNESKKIESSSEHRALQRRAGAMQIVDIEKNPIYTRLIRII